MPSPICHLPSPISHLVILSRQSRCLQQQHLTPFDTLLRTSLRRTRSQGRAGCAVFASFDAPRETGAPKKSGRVEPGQTKSNRRPPRVRVKWRQAGCLSYGWRPPQVYRWKKMSGRKGHIAAPGDGRGPAEKIFVSPRGFLMHVVNVWVRDVKHASARCSFCFSTT